MRPFFYCPGLLLFLIAMALPLASCGDASDPAVSLPAGTATAAGDEGMEASVIFRSATGDVRLRVDVARSESERARGLMYVRSLEPDRGMIFVWDDPVHEGFWMKDTYVPLSIAFISGDLAIAEIQDMQPGTLTPHIPAEPYRYAVEANQGFFREHGITTGDKVELVGVP